MSPRRKRYLIGAAIGGALTALLIAAAARIPFSSDVLRDRVVATLSERLDAVVALDGLTLRALPTLHAEGTGLTIRHRGRTDVPPLISVQTFIVDANLIDVWRRRVTRVRLDGLEIQIPPDDTPDDTEQPIAITGTHLVEGDQVVVEELIADAAKLVIIPRNREKQHRTWVMHKLRVENVGANTRMPFQTTLTNAVPPGEIVTQGSFGPWHRDDPGHTPIAGTFLFNKADLSVFKGISGTLDARGSYNGRLDTLVVKGETTIPDFTVSVAGHGVPLDAVYDAVIDGTNGDTKLERVEATFLNTTVTASGGVYDVELAADAGKSAPKRRGREIVLAVAIDRGRLEDVMRLAVKSTRPPMTGALSLQTKFVIPAGGGDVVDKLQLDGQFSIENGRFTDQGVQQKINDMSRRASGRIGAAREQPTAPRVNSDFQGRFTQNDAVLRLPTLVFDIPGAAVRLAGQYSLRRETINFAGNLYMDARVSQTVTGWKSMLLKIADPLFRENGQTVVPIKISGTRTSPSFGVDVKRVLTR